MESLAERKRLAEKTRKQKRKIAELKARLEATRETVVVNNNTINTTNNTINNTVVYKILPWMEPLKRTLYDGSVISSVDQFRAHVCKVLNAEKTLGLRSTNMRDGMLYIKDVLREYTDKVPLPAECLKVIEEYVGDANRELAKLKD